MNQEHGIDEIRPNPDSVLTVGAFDGIHRGHQAILRKVKRRARDLGGPATLVTFDPHPREVLSDRPVPLLTTIEERAQLAEEEEIDRFVVLPFTREFSELTPEEYVQDVLLGKVGMQGIVVGYDHRFGRGQEGTTETLRALGRRADFGVVVVSAEELGDRTISSSEIRRLLREKGAVQKAAQLLGRPYRLGGVVVRGEGRGRKIGYPTANIRPEHPRKLVPAKGVYAIRARLSDDSDPRAHGGMMNIGVRPTFEKDEETVVEAHLFDFDGNLYGEEVVVEFVERVRDERAFSSVDELATQLENDEKRCKELLEVVDS